MSCVGGQKTSLVRLYPASAVMPSANYCKEFYLLSSCRRTCFFFGSQLERDFIEKNAYGIMYLHGTFGSDW